MVTLKIFLSQGQVLNRSRRGIVGGEGRSRISIAAFAALRDPPRSVNKLHTTTTGPARGRGWRSLQAPATTSKSQGGSSTNISLGTDAQPVLAETARTQQNVSNSVLMVLVRVVAVLACVANKNGHGFPILKTRAPACCGIRMCSRRRRRVLYRCFCGPPEAHCGKCL
jgi:hypothetical protein